MAKSAENIPHRYAVNKTADEDFSEIPQLVQILLRAKATLSGKMPNTSNHMGEKLKDILSW